MSRRSVSLPPILIAVVLAPLSAARADFAEAVSDSVGFVLGGYTLYLSQGTRQDKQEAKDLTNAMFVTGAATQALKEVVHAQRPDRSNDDSFPSMHVSLTAAWAEVAKSRHPKQRWFYDAYLGAMMWSRVETDKHYERDVIAGALLGAALGKKYSAQHRGVVLGKMSW